jgi:hypothetical protein
MHTYKRPSAAGEAGTWEGTDPTPTLVRWHRLVAISLDISVSKATLSTGGLRAPHACRGGGAARCVWAARATHTLFGCRRSKKNKVIFRTICFYSQAMKAATSLTPSSGGFSASRRVRRLMSFEPLLCSTLRLTPILMHACGIMQQTASRQSHCRLTPPTSLIRVKPFSSSIFLETLPLLPNSSPCIPDSPSRRALFSHFTPSAILQQPSIAKIPYRFLVLFPPPAPSSPPSHTSPPPPPRLLHPPSYSPVQPGERRFQGSFTPPPPPPSASPTNS